jgi:hypothetical protein
MDGQQARPLTSSYHAFKREAGVALAISLGKPKWPLAYEIAADVDELKPWGLLARPPLEQDEFRRRYVERLDRIGVERLRATFDRIAAEHGEPLVLLCWENVHAGKFCHRRVFADWWAAQTGEEVPEL